MANLNLFSLTDHQAAVRERKECQCESLTRDHGAPTKSWKKDPALRSSAGSEARRATEPAATFAGEQWVVVEGVA